MKRLLRFLKLFIAFFLVMTGIYGAWVFNHEMQVGNRDAPTFLSISLVAVGLAILWTDWHRVA